jgi:hypothetical protein
MTRPVRQSESLWFDHHFKKAFKKLPGPEQKKRLAELANLVEKLADCTHPILDPRLSPWKPSAYHVPKVPHDKQLCEYRCTFPMRVIAQWIEPCLEDPEGAVLLVAVTLSHDHERLKEIISRNRSSL